MSTNSVMTTNVLGHAHAYAMDVHAYVTALAPRVVTAALLIGVFWIGARAVQTVIMRVARRGDAPLYDVLQLAGRVAFGALLVTGVIMALDTVGVRVNAIIAGLGLSGFALGLAMRDALTNVLSGMLIIIYRPFRRGDRILVTGIEGNVRSVDLRYTTLCADGRTILIPNSTMFNSTVTIISTAAQA